MRDQLRDDVKGARPKGFRALLEAWNASTQRSQDDFVTELGEARPGHVLQGRSRLAKAYREASREARNAFSELQLRAEARK